MDGPRKTDPKKVRKTAKNSKKGWKRVHKSVKMSNAWSERIIHRRIRYNSSYSMTHRTEYPLFLLMFENPMVP
jgi:hypothetical protein